LSSVQVFVFLEKSGTWNFYKPTDDYVHIFLLC
jgi:hypothetical protein